jgi:hypothetical protein
LICRTTDAESPLWPTTAVGRTHTVSPHNRKELNMTFLQRSLAAAGALGAVAFVIAFAFRHSRHGVGALAGDAAWSSLFVAVLALLILGTAAVAVAVRSRRDDRSILR